MSTNLHVEQPSNREGVRQFLFPNSDLSYDQLREGINSILPYPEIRGGITGTFSRILLRVAGNRIVGKVLANSPIRPDLERLVNPPEGGRDLVREAGYYKWLANQSDLQIQEAVRRIRGHYVDNCGGSLFDIQYPEVERPDTREFSVASITIESFGTHLSSLISAGLDAASADKIFTALRGEVLSAFLPQVLDGDDRLELKTLQRMEMYGILYEADIRSLLARYHNSIRVLTSNTYDLYGEAFVDMHWTEEFERTARGLLSDVAERLQDAYDSGNLRILRTFVGGHHDWHEYLFNKEEFLDGVIPNTVKAINNYRRTVMVLLDYAITKPNIRPAAIGATREYLNLLVRGSRGALYIES